VKPVLPPEAQVFVSEYVRFFEESLQQTNTPCAALVMVRDSQILFMRGYGSPGCHVDEHTVFRIGSLSKGFAGVLTGMLVQEGLLCWDDPVQRHYPAFNLRDRQQASRVKIWHLLSHTTGLPYHAYTNLVEKGYSTDKIVREFFPKAPVSGKEGEFFAYQNAAFSVIEEVILARTGKTYHQWLQEKVFLPAGMANASCDYAHIMSESNKALPMSATGLGTWKPDVISPNYYNTVAAGGVNASIADMAQWLKLLLGQRPEMVADSTLDRVLSPVVKTDKERRIFPRWLARDAASYAMGWRVLNDHGDTVFYHGGYVNGYKSEIAFDRKKGIGICALFNAPTQTSNDCVPAFFEMWKASLKGK
jgi:beta-lactamase class C